MSNLPENPTNADLAALVVGAVKEVQDAQEVAVNATKNLTVHLSDGGAHGAQTQDKINKAMPKPIIEGTSLSFASDDGTIITRAVDLKGEKGDPGSNGVAGVDGPIGPRPGHKWLGTSLAVQKPDGTWPDAGVDLKGDKGEKGETGEPGLKGEQGTPGPAGGPQGDKGDTGPRPDHQWEGTALKVQKPDGTWPDAGVDLKGDKGDKGDTGNTGAPGRDGVNGADGKDGDAATALHNKTANAHGLDDPESGFRASVTSIAATEGQKAAVAEVAKLEMGTTSPVFGICQVRKGGGSGLYFHVDEHGNPVNLVTDYFDRHEVYRGISREIIDGQVLNAIPQFHVKHYKAEDGPLKGCPITMFSPGRREGFHIHPAFMNNGKEISKFLLGCYKGSLNATSTKIESVSGAYPAVSKDFSTFKALCTNHNVGGVEGFMMQDVYQKDARNLLMMAELANANVQTVLGMGHVAGSAAVTVDSPANHRPWRGFHGIYGNVWEMVDGVRADGNRKLEIFRNDGTRAYLSTNITIPVYGSGLTGWVVDMLDDVSDGYDMRDVFIPKTLDGNEFKGSYGDGMYGAVANGVCYAGGNWGNGSEAGAFLLYFSSVASYSNTHIGVRLAKV